MKADPEVLELLNEVLTAELTAINQYFIHAKMTHNWGYSKLAEHMRHESIDEMKDADKVIERILYFDGRGDDPWKLTQASLSLDPLVVEQLESLSYGSGFSLVLRRYSLYRA